MQHGAATKSGHQSHLSLQGVNVQLRLKGPFVHDMNACPLCNRATPPDAWHLLTECVPILTPNDHLYTAADRAFDNLWEPLKKEYADWVKDIQTLKTKGQITVRKQDGAYIGHNPAWGRTIYANQYRTKLPRKDPKSKEEARKVTTKHRDELLDPNQADWLDLARKELKGKHLWGHDVANGRENHAINLAIIANCPFAVFTNIKELYQAKQADDKEDTKAVFIESRLNDCLKRARELLAPLDDTTDQILTQELSLAIKILGMASNRRLPNGRLLPDVPPHPRRDYDRWHTKRILAFHLPNAPLNSLLTPALTDKDGKKLDDDARTAELERVALLKKTIYGIWTDIHRTAKIIFDAALNKIANNKARAAFLRIETHDNEDYPMNRTQEEHAMLSNTQKDEREERKRTRDDSDLLLTNEINEMNKESKRKDNVTAASQIGPLMLQELLSNPVTEPAEFQLPGIRTINLADINVNPRQLQDLQAQDVIQQLAHGQSSTASSLDETLPSSHSNSSSHLDADSEGSSSAASSRVPLARTVLQELDEELLIDAPSGESERRSSASSSSDTGSSSSNSRHRRGKGHASREKNKKSKRRNSSSD